MQKFLSQCSNSKALMEDNFNWEIWMITLAYLWPQSTDINAQQQLRDLREQYARLQDDYKSKLCEVSCMRAEAEKMKQDIRDAKEEKERMEIKLIDAQERLKLLESEKEKFEGNFFFVMKLNKENCSIFNV